MHWKEKLTILEKHDDFDVAIFFLESVIKDHPNDVDAYIFILFRLMDTIVEHACHFSNVSQTPVSDIKKEYYDSKEDCYEVLAKKYFVEGYEKFSENAQFLFYVGMTAVMSEWYFGIDRKDYERMLDKAMLLEPDNLLYQEPYYACLDLAIEANRKATVQYASRLFDAHSLIRAILITKGSLGEYLLEIITGWRDEILRIPSSEA